VAAVVILPDWEANQITQAQADNVKKMIDDIKSCSQSTVDGRMKPYLDAMTITGVFKQNEPDGDNDDSKTKNGQFLGYGNRTILAHYWFTPNFGQSIGYKPDKFRVLTLLHESYHAATEDWTESQAPNYAASIYDEIKCCLKQQGLDLE